MASDGLRFQDGVSNWFFLNSGEGKGRQFLTGSRSGEIRVAKHNGESSFLTMQELGKWMVVAGIALALVGLYFWLGGSKLGLGRLPGDIAYEKEGVRIYFPVVTCLIISVVLSAIMWFFRR